VSLQLDAQRAERAGESDTYWVRELSPETRASYFRLMKVKAELSPAQYNAWLNAQLKLRRELTPPHFEDDGDDCEI
jgi:hypothetical protein